MLAVFQRGLSNFELVVKQFGGIKKTVWFQSASKLYRPSDRRLSAKLVPTFLGDLIQSEQCSCKILSESLKNPENCPITIKNMGINYM
jgi:hypothetical protein